MTPSQDTQLENVIDEVFKSGDAQALNVFLQRDIYKGTPIKCSKQFLTKLDKLISRWFEKCRQLWIQCGPWWDETLYNLSEDFFDALMVVHEACKQDYDLQVALMEALCRMATPDQRKELADRWFNMQHVASAFVKIRDSEFETDCRKFLNLVNGMQGDRRRVYSYPCLEAYLDKHELLMPTDEKLEEFWIDFNLGSHSISFYFSLADGEGQGFEGKTGMSVVKTTVKIIMDQNSSQIQASAKMKISESTNFINSSSTGGSVHGASSLSAVPSKNTDDKSIRYGSNWTGGRTDSGSSNWNKLSVSEMLMMPTQKMNSLPRTDSCLSLAQQPERPLPAQRLSVPGSGPIKQKQLHVKLNQRLQEVRNKRNQNPAPQEPAVARTKFCDIKEDSKSRSSADRRSSTLCTSKEQQAQRNVPTKGKSKGQMSLEADSDAVKAPVKPSTTKALQERITPNVEVKTNGTLSRKEKEKRYVNKNLFSDTDTDCGMTEVSWLRESSRKPKPKVTKYSRPVPNKPKALSLHASYDSPDLPPASPKPVKGNTKPNKKPDMKKAVKQPKKTVKPAAEPRRPHAAGRRPQRAAAITAKSYREPDTDDSQSESEKLLASKLAKTEKNNETAQVRKKKMGSKAPTKRYMKLESNNHSSQSDSVSEQPPISKKYFVGQKCKSDKTCQQVPEVNETKNTYSEQSADIYRRLDCNNQTEVKKPSGLKERSQNVLQETTKFNKTNITPTQEQMNALKESWAARQASFSPSPPFIQRMRSADRSAPTLGLTLSPLLTLRGSPLPASPDPPCQETPSPVLLLPKPRSTVSSNGNFKASFYSAKKTHSTSKTQYIQSISPSPSLTSRGQTPAASRPTRPSTAETSPVQQQPFSIPRSPLSLSARPLLTSTLLELDKPSMPSPSQSPFPEDTVNRGCHYGFSKVSPLSQVSLSQSSVLSIKVKDSPTVSLAMSHKTEKTPSSGQDLKSGQLHISGSSRKRRISLSSNSEEHEREERKKSKMRGQRSPRMRPRKLFKSFAEVSAESEVSRMMSSSHTVSSSHWEAEVAVGDIDMDEDLELPEMAVNPTNLCQQFSSELKKKFQNRSKMMEVYNKQSLKTVQQHVSSLNMQVTKYRTQRLEQVQKVLMEEIHKLEQDDTVLKNMEKDLTMYWKKQTVAFQSYQEQETRSFFLIRFLLPSRNKTLKKALQSNVCHSLEYEERIFTSQMCLIRKDMKSVQDRLLSEMHEGEIKSVKRGLHALFFPDGARF
ncbi:hypothetical protein PAMP_011876 [Pampus punctatissimus]